MKSIRPAAHRLPRYVLLAAFFSFIFLAVALPAQNQNVRTGNFSVPIKGEWDIAFTGTNHYYLDDSGEKVWHGAATVNQTLSNKDDLYAFGQYIDSYTDKRSCKVNANYKDDRLDGAFSYHSVTNIQLKINRNQNISATVTLNGRYTLGNPTDNWKLVADMRQGSNVLKSNVSANYKDGTLLKYDEKFFKNGGLDKEYHISFDDRNRPSGTITNDEVTDLSFRNGVITDRYYDREGDIYQVGEYESDVINRYANGIIDDDSLIDLGYTLDDITVRNISENFLTVVNDDEVFNLLFYARSSTRFSQLDVSLRMLTEVKLTSYNDFSSQLENMDISDLKKLRAALDTGCCYRSSDYYRTSVYFNNATRQLILARIPSLMDNVQKKMRDENFNRFESRLRKALDDKRYEITEVVYNSDNQVDSACFDVYVDYPNGLGFFMRKCSISRKDNSYSYEFPSTDLVNRSVSSGVPVRNEWNDVQERYADIVSLHSKVFAAAEKAKFLDLYNYYSNYYNQQTAGLRDLSAAQVLSAIDNIEAQQNRYLRLIELRKAFDENHNIIVNMDVKHGEHIIEAYQLHYNMLNRTFVSAADLDRLQQQIDIQTSIIAALRSEDVKKLDKKVKKSDDKSIQTVLHLLQSE